MAPATRPKHEFRRSAQALLWNHKGWALKTIANALEVCSQTVSSWLTAFEKAGLAGLRRQKGQGRKPILSITNTTHQQALSKAVDAHCQDAGRIQVHLQAALGQPMSCDTVKRFLKKTTIPTIAYAEAPKPTRTGKLCRRAGALRFPAGTNSAHPVVSLRSPPPRLYFADEVGFTQQLYVPYGWQKKHQPRLLYPPARRPKV